jgi:hypothetical protein
MKYKKTNVGCYKTLATTFYDTSNTGTAIRSVTTKFGDFSAVGVVLFAMLLILSSEVHNMLYIEVSNNGYSTALMICI